MEKSGKSSTPFNDQLKERSARMKRKAGEELRPHSAKRSPSASLSMDTSSSRPSGSTSLANAPCESIAIVYLFTKADRYMPASLSSAIPSKVTIAYPNGALRITRTPGRQKTKNCVNLEDVIHKQHLVSACVFSFFIAESEFYRHFPFSDSSDAVPVSVRAIYYQGECN
jgi:tyrosyl-DNA phosphodiesterase-1